MKFNFKPLLVVILSSVVFVTGCSNTIRKSEKIIKRDTHVAQKHLQDLKRTKIEPAYVQLEKPRFLGKSVKLTQEYPKEFNRTYTINYPLGANLSKVANALSVHSGIPVNVNKDAKYRMDVSNETSMVNTQKNGLTALMSKPKGVKPPTTVGSNMASALVSGKAKDEPVPEKSEGEKLIETGNQVLMVSGELVEVLDEISVRFGVSWEYKNNHIRFYRFIRNIFELSNFGVTMSDSASMDGDEDSDESDSSSESVWTGITETVKAMLSKEGSLQSSEATGTLVVTDVQKNMDVIEEYINITNESLSRQVYLRIDILEVVLEDEDKYGFNLTGILTKASRTVTLNTTSGLEAGINSLTGAATSGEHTGSKAVIQAIEEQRNISKLITRDMYTLNNQPVPINLSSEQGYLSDVTSVVTGESVSTSYSQKVISTGLVMKIKPRISSNNKVMVEYVIDQSTLKNLSAVGGEDTFVQTPEINRALMRQIVMLKSGHFAAIQATEQHENRTGKQGVGHESNMLLGGSKTGTENKSVIIVLLEARVI